MISNERLSRCVALKVFSSLLPPLNSYELTLNAGMALAPWNVIAAGRLRSDEDEKKREESGEKGRALHFAGWKWTEAERKVSAALEQVGKEVGGASVATGTMPLISGSLRSCLYVALSSVHSS